jgi:hypothetical protein
MSRRNLLLTLFALLMFMPAAAHAQGRISDSDLERLMKNLKDDAKPFKNSFNNGLKHSTIRGTSQEKDAKTLGETFVTQSNVAYNVFKKQHKAENEVTALVATAGQIEGVFHTVTLEPAAAAQWQKVRTELHQVAQAFNIPEPYLESSPRVAPMAGTMR